MQLVTGFDHYRDHLLPIWDALPADLRTKDHGARTCADRNALLLVGGWADVERHPYNPYVYVEHGVGQTYVGVNSPAYVGGRGHRGAKLFVCPSERVADVWRDAYPHIPTVVVGCPKLDPWLSGRRGSPLPGERTVAVTFHWDCKVVPATRSAWSHYRNGMHETVLTWRRQGWEVLGHGHPRMWDRLRTEGSAIGVEPVQDCAEVLDRANLLVADNTSLMAEFIALNRPVLALSCPHYNGAGIHGGRFGQWGIPEVDGHEQLRSIVLDSVPVSTFEPYALNDGHAAQRAAAAITELIR